MLHLGLWSFLSQVSQDTGTVLEGFRLKAGAGLKEANVWLKCPI